MMLVFEELKQRGLIAQCTNEEKVRDLLDNHTGVPFYIGFDATADSLHVGHFLQLVVMSRMQKAGHKPIALIGGATTMIGDPTGKTDMRKMLTREEIDHNAECFRRQMRRLVDFSEGKAVMVNNADWILPFNYMEFLREVGVHFSVNRMLTAECFKSRLEGKGLSFLEFNYMLLQSYDFLHLYRTMGCKLELGGDDQWSNIINGADLIRRVDGKDDAYGMTFTLLTTSEGKKMGKTEKGAVWLDPEKTTPYEFFQYWRNIDDADVIKVMKLLTFMPLEEIAAYEKLEGSQLNSAKEKLAHELTAMVHGQEEADKALEAAKAVFGGGVSSENMPTTELTPDDFEDGVIGILSLLVKCGLAASNGEARKLVQGGGVSIDGEKVADPKATVAKGSFNGEKIIKKGKKTFHKVVLR
ncbi:tyrosine--tRNA ligase [Intestinibacillus massiliensis]|uniref:tyrosine--tRNA ligase n=1 Tax=Intestinibacillus massiliensis TaxID=1871029 RepID=UPI000B353739|nr:tyrosine--tRNA ligase [Intestinibacillus massiliensis]